MSCADEVQNNDETDIDCGGDSGACRGCGIGQKCLFDRDCYVGNCLANFCATFAPTAVPSVPFPTAIPTLVPTTTPPYVKASIPVQLDFDDEGLKKFNETDFKNALSGVIGGSSSNIEVRGGTFWFTCD